MNPITIEIAGTNAELNALRADWQGLFAVSGGSPFLSWEWMTTWYEWFGDNRRPFVLKAYRGDSLIGLLPMFFEKKRIFGISVSRVALMGERTGGADYLDVIADPDLKPAVVSSIIDFFGTQKDIDHFSLEGVHAEFGVGTGVGESMIFSSDELSVCPGIDLGEGWDAVLKNSKRAENFKRRLKKLEKTIGFEYRSVTAADGIEDAFERFLELHEARWLGSGGSELCGHPRLAGFQREAVIKMAAVGRVRFDELWAEGKCRASVYGMESAGTFYYFNSGYDLDWSSKSVGLVLIGLSVRHAIERGIKYYDFLRGPEGYKYDWANAEARIYSVEYTRPGIQAFARGLVGAISRNLKTTSNRVLPVRVAEALKTQKRRIQRRRMGGINADANA